MPFNRFRTVEGISVDTILGPEMKSTGEVMGLDIGFGTAFAKSQVAGFGPLPTKGTVFVSVANRDKRFVIFPVKRLADLGFEILATAGTASMLRRHGVKVTTVRKYSQGPGPDGEQTIVQAILDGEVDLIFNTPHGLSPDGRPRFDGYEIRTAAVLRNVPCVTTVQGLAAAVQGIEAIRAGQHRGALPAVLVRRRALMRSRATRGWSGRCCSGPTAATPSGCTRRPCGRSARLGRLRRPVRAGWPRCAPGTAPRSPWPGSSSPGVVGLAAGMDKNGVARPVLGRARLRARRARHGHRAGPAGQRPAAAVPAAAEPGDRQPDGLQQRRRRGAGRPAGRRRGGAGQPRASASRSASPSARPRSPRWPRRPHGLPDLAAAAGPVRGLPRRQRVQPQHPGTALAAGRRHPGRPARGAGRRGRRLAAHGRLPIFVKLAPDLTEDALEQALDVSRRRRGRRADRHQHHAGPRRAASRRPGPRPARPGGLSGAPLTVRARAVVALPGRRGPTLPVIGVGGIMTARRRPGAARRRRPPAAGLHRLRLRRPGAGHRLNRDSARRHGEDEPMTEAPYGARLRRAVAERGPLCVGIDPHPGDCWTPGGSAAGRRPAWSAAPAAWSRPSGDMVAVFKPQSAFFEAYGSAGHRRAGAHPGRHRRHRRAVPARRQARRHRLDHGRVRRGLPHRRRRRWRPTRSPSAPTSASGRWPARSTLAAGQGRGVYVLALTSNPEGPQVQHARVADGRIGRRR